jgi:uncharacterized protein with PQ loop repeat
MHLAQTRADRRATARRGTPPCYRHGAALALLSGQPANAAIRSSVQSTRDRHTLTETLGAAAAAWGVLMAISPALQIRRMLARRSSGDVSITYLLVLEFGFFLWIGYGIALGNPFIVFPNCVAAVVGALTMLVAWIYRDGVGRVA